MLSSVTSSVMHSSNQPDYISATEIGRLESNRMTQLILKCSKDDPFGEPKRKYLRRGVQISPTLPLKPTQDKYTEESKTHTHNLNDACCAQMRKVCPVYLEEKSFPSKHEESINSNEKNGTILQERLRN